MKKLVPYRFFEAALVPKDYLLEEKNNDFSKDLAPETQTVGQETLQETTDYLTIEMEIPYEYEWLVGITIQQAQVAASFKESVFHQLATISENIANLLGYEIPISDDWSESYEEVENTLYQLLSPLSAQRLSEEEFFYAQRYQFLRYVPHLREEVIANRHLANVTDTVIKVAQGFYSWIVTMEHPI